MGNDASRADDHNKSLLSRFSTNEMQAIQNMFISLSGKDKRQLTENVLQRHLGELFPAKFTAPLHHVMAHINTPSLPKAPAPCIGGVGFSVSMSYLLKADAHQQAHMVKHLASDTPTSHISASQLYKLIEILLRIYYSVLVHREQAEISKVWREKTPPTDAQFELLTFLSLSDLFYPDKQTQQAATTANQLPDKNYSDDDLIRWIGHSQLFANAYNFVFNHAFPVCEMPPRSLLPIFVGKSCTSDHIDLLSPLDILAINQAIPYKLREKWTLLFDSRKQGESFTTLLRSVKDQKNTVLVVRDTDGRVFGGFSTAVWSNNAAFKGSIDNFLFSIKPLMRIYKPTGLNTNYFYLNTGQETFPNGMGMGGQLNYFALWLDCEYGMGHSMAKPLSTTFHSPTLSAKPEFHYTDVEVWRVSNIQEDIEEAEAKAEQRGATSILDSDPGAKAILELIGKGGQSDGLRESDPTASNPEQTEPPVI